ncbi:MAG TPA: hypothetical protein VF789_07075 [Thermoanaerobaculia bacterium]
MLRARFLAFTLLLTTALPGLAAADSIELVSRAPVAQAPDTTGGSDLGYRRSLSSDGRYLTFISVATNLVSGQVDANANDDIFFYDRVADTMTLVSHAANVPRRTGDGRSHSPTLSADGRWIAFLSDATDLVEDLPEGLPTARIYLYETSTGDLTLVGKDPESAGPPILSADGGWVAFIRFHAGKRNVEIYERATGNTILVAQYRAVAEVHGLSADGRFLLFTASDRRKGSDVFLYDRVAGATTLVSHAAGAPLTAANGLSYSPSLSASGQFVVFVSRATNLISDLTDANRKPDVFLYDRLTGALSLVNRDPARPNATIAWGGFGPAISADGSTIAWFDADPVLQPWGGHLFLTDRVTGATTQVDAGANRGAHEAALSGDGRRVAFTSRATNLVAGQQDQRSTFDIFLYDRPSRTTVLASHAARAATRAANQDSVTPALSTDGEWLAYFSFAGDLAAGLRDALGEDIFFYEVDTAANRVATRHGQGLASRTTFETSDSPAVSGDGRYVAFSSYATDLIPGQVEGNFIARDIFLYDRITHATVLVSHSTASPVRTANGESQLLLISRDGGVVVFFSVASDLVPGQRVAPDTAQVYLWDRRTGKTVLVSHASASLLQGGNGFSVPVQVSADGNTVLFRSAATDLIPGFADRTETSADFFLYDRRTGTITLASRALASPVWTGNGRPEAAAMSADGSVVAFSSYATDLTPDSPPEAAGGVYVFEKGTGKVTRIVVDGGAAAPAAFSNIPLLSADGRYIAFLNANGDARDLVLLDRVAGTALKVAPVGNLRVSAYGLSDDGRYLLFLSGSGEVVPGQIDANTANDLFLFDRVTRETRLVSHLPGRPLETAPYGVDHGLPSAQGLLSADGRYVAFVSISPELEPSPAPPFRSTFHDVFLYDRTTETVTLVSRSRVYPGRGGAGPSYTPSISASGGFVAFASQASDFVPKDLNSNSDVFLYIPAGGLP